MGDPSLHTAYTLGVLTGLIFSLGGDIALMIPDNKKAFRIGVLLRLPDAHCPVSRLFCAGNLKKVV